jgi:hypothetical protein
VPHLEGVAHLGIFQFYLLPKLNFGRKFSSQVKLGKEINCDATRGCNPLLKA